MEVMDPYYGGMEARSGARGAPYAMCASEHPPLPVRPRGPEGSDGSSWRHEHQGRVQKTLRRVRLCAVLCAWRCAAPAHRRATSFVAPLLCCAKRRLARALRAGPAHLRHPRPSATSPSTTSLRRLGNREALPPHRRTYKPSLGSRRQRSSYRAHCAQYNEIPIVPLESDHVASARPPRRQRRCREPCPDCMESQKSEGTAM